MSNQTPEAPVLPSPTEIARHVERLVSAAESLSLMLEAVALRPRPGRRPRW